MLNPGALAPACRFLSAHSYFLVDFLCTLKLACSLLQIFLCALTLACRFFCTHSHLLVDYYTNSRELTLACRFFWTHSHFLVDFFCAHSPMYVCRISACTHTCLYIFISALTLACRFFCAHSPFMVDFSTGPHTRLQILQIFCTHSGPLVTSNFCVKLQKCCQHVKVDQPEVFNLGFHTFV